MGTRSDFYVGRTRDAEWLGSVAMDGYPSGIAQEILQATNEQDYRNAVEKFLSETSHATIPEQGWPWPWQDSNTSDFAYAWDEGVWHTTGWRPTRWWKYSDGEEPGDGDEKALASLEATDFPNMEQIANVTLGHRSGLVIVTR